MPPSSSPSPSAPPSAAPSPPSPGPSAAGRPRGQPDVRTRSLVRAATPLQPALVEVQSRGAAGFAPCVPRQWRCGRLSGDHEQPHEEGKKDQPQELRIHRAVARRPAPPTTPVPADSSTRAAAGCASPATALRNPPLYSGRGQSSRSPPLLTAPLTQSRTNS